MFQSKFMTGQLNIFNMAAVMFQDDIVETFFHNLTTSKYKRYKSYLSSSDNSDSLGSSPNWLDTRSSSLSTKPSLSIPSPITLFTAL